jgi:hypothetical protein
MLSIRTPVRTRLALLSTTAVAAVSVLGAFSALVPASANASYYGGCTYTWGTPCYIVYGGINYLITQDPDHAASTWGSAPPWNGYKVPKHDGIERDICGTIMAHEGTLGPYGWSCGWGQVVENYPGITGYSAIGGAEYYGIALYQMIDYGEYGPCPAQGSPEC